MAAHRAGRASTPPAITPLGPPRVRTPSYGNAFDSMPGMSHANSSPSDLAETVARAGTTDRAVLDALQRVPRAAFVPEARRRHAYEDRPVDIPHGQVTTQPSLVAGMIEALKLAGDEIVLEIGSGYGFQTALLAQLCRFVWSVEWFADLAETARSNVAEQGITNVAVVAADGSTGLPQHAPFGGIVVSAASPQVPGPLVEQLAEGGRLVHPLGRGGREDVVCFQKRGAELVRLKSVTPARFVPLRTDDGRR